MDLSWSVNTVAPHTCTRKARCRRGCTGGGRRWEVSLLARVTRDRAVAGFKQAHQGLPSLTMATRIIRRTTVIARTPAPKARDSAGMLGSLQDPRRPPRRSRRQAARSRRSRRSTPTRRPEGGARWSRAKGSQSSGASAAYRRDSESSRDATTAARTFRRGTRCGRGSPPCAISCFAPRT